MDAKQIRELIRDAEERGRNVYATHLVVNTIGLISDKSLRIIAAKTVAGQTLCRTLHDGQWCRTSYSTVFDAR